MAEIYKTINVKPYPTVKASFMKRLSKDFGENKYVYLMALPIVLYYGVFKYIPMGGLIIAFQNYNVFKGITDSDWVGMKHFIDFLAGPYAWRTIRNTIYLSLYGVIFGFPCPIILALLINEVKSAIFKKTVQTVSYMPHFISLVVVCGMLIDFSSSKGLFNQISVFFGLGEVSILNDARYFRTVYTASSIWQTMGWSSIIYIATISSVDPNLYEAAYMDGAGRFDRVLHITFPALIPIITVQLIMRVGNLLSVGFEKVILLYNPLTYETADIISSYVYRRGIQESNYSFGAAVGLFNSFVNILVLISVNQLCKKSIKESLW